MPNHKFGILQAPPGPGWRCEYDPQKYGCIAVRDDDLLPLAKALRGVRCCWHTPDRPEWGLAWCGITLIPPGSLETMIDVIWKDGRLSGLFALLAEARRGGSWVIHFGI